MEQKPKKQTYKSYLIRCWSSSAFEIEQQLVRRFIVETISNTPQRYGFDSLADLLTFLQQELEGEDPLGKLP